MTEDINLNYPTVAKGQRSQFFENGDVDQVMTFIVSLLNELMVTRDRLDTVERILAAEGLMAPERIEEFKPDAAQTAEKNAMKRDIIKNVLRLHADAS